eukprot:1380322-Amorphochlora_amoeboformis.AAC.1
MGTLEIVGDPGECWRSLFFPVLPDIARCYPMFLVLPSTTWVLPGSWGFRILGMIGVTSRHITIRNFPEDPSAP